jgi:hypothetical protein
MRSSLRNQKLVSRSILVFGSLSIISFLLVIPFELGNSSAQKIGDRKRKSDSQSRPQLDAQRRSELRRLFERLRAGEPFSVDEANILNRFASGQAVTDVEADVVISRGLYNYYVLGRSLTRKQESLLDAFASAVSRREHDIGDLKLGQSTPATIASQTKAGFVPDGAPPPANDTCAAPTSLILNTPVSGTTIGATNDYEISDNSLACFTGIGQVLSTAGGLDVVYSFTAPAAGDYSFRVVTTFSSSNPVLYVASSCPTGSPTNPDCLGAANRSNGDNPSIWAEEVMCLPLTASQLVFIFVDNAFGASDFTIEVTRCTRETEDNDTPLTGSPIPFGVEGSITPSEADFYLLGTPPAGSRVFSLVDGIAANDNDFDLRVTTDIDTLEYDDLNNDTPFGFFSPNVAGTPLTGVRSFLRVDHFDGDVESEPYRLYTVIQPPGSNQNCNCSAVNESEPNDTTAQADTAPNTFFYGALSDDPPLLDVDLFSFTARAGDLIFLSLDGDPTRDDTPINGALALLDSGGNVLVSVDDGGAFSDTTSGAGSLTATSPSFPAEGLIWRATVTGTYFASVTRGEDFDGKIIGAESGTGINVDDYLLSISRNGQVGPSAANGIVSGRITDSSGAAVAGAVVNLAGTQTRKTITDANGNYRFEQIETNGFYTVTPSRANFGFNPANRSFSQLGERTEANFSASAFAEVANPLDTPEFFVRQQYVDLLGREPDEGGFNYWSEQILACGSDAGCIHTRRLEVAAAFFIEAEFQRTGSFLYGLYKSALGRQPFYQEFSVDRVQLIDGPNLEAIKQAFAESFVQRPEFLAKYQAHATAESFVDALLRSVQQTSGVDLSSQRAELISRYNAGTSLSQSRSLALRSASESPEFRQGEYNPAFVLTEYFGYLRREPDRGGYAFWLDVLNNRVPGNYRSMVCAFITSAEYQRRFSSMVSGTNASCGP